MIVDTTFILDLLGGNADAVNKAKELEETNEPVFFTTISVFELWQGIEDIRNAKKRNRILQILSCFNYFDFTMESSKIAGNIHASLIRKGLRIDPEDSMIAGITKSKNETILTRNVKHFKRIGGLKVEYY